MQLNPIAFYLFGEPVSWYWLNYVFGFFLAFLILEKAELAIRAKRDRILILGWIGIFVGGRLGYCLFYNFSFYQNNTLEIFKLWNGGMSFHGAFTGCVLGIAQSAKWDSLTTWKILDTLTPLAPLMIFFGRICNFLNQELIGRKTDSAWGVLFDRVSVTQKFFPSQIYEAVAEGLFVFIMIFIFRVRLLKTPGALTCFFIAIYSIVRFICEFFREPDLQVGYFFGVLTLGQIFCGLFFFVSVFTLQFLRRVK